MCRREVGRGLNPVKLYTGRFRPELQLLTLLCTMFDRKGTPFVYFLLTNGTPFTNLLKNFASLLTAVKALSFGYEYPTSKLSGALWRRGEKRKDSLQLRLWNLNSTFTSPVAPRQSARRKRARMYVNKHKKHVPMVMASLLMSSPPISILH